MDGITVGILVYLALGLCIGLLVWRDSVLGLDKAPPLVAWAAVAIVGVPVLIGAVLLWLVDLITGRR